MYNVLICVCKFSLKSSGRTIFSLIILFIIHFKCNIDSLLLKDLFNEQLLSHILQQKAPKKPCNKVT